MKRRKSREMEADLDMTTFINLMVVLLAFLLVTSAFTELSMLQVNLPSAGGGGAGGSEPKKPLVLEVSIYKDQFIVSDRQSGPMKILPSLPTGHDYKGLNEYLTSIKASYPALTEVTLLLQPLTDYDTLIHTMDTVRYKPRMVNGTWIKSELFPDIGIGDAPEHPGGKS
jgi:biopolymer transport protein ExbD